MKKKNSKTTKWLIIGVAVLLAVTVFGVGAALLSNVEQPDNSNGSIPSDPSACKHATLSTVYTLEGDSTHRTVSVCQDCKKTVKDEMEAHVYDGDGKCKMGDCGYQCKHSAGTVIVYKSSSAEQHQKSRCCKTCLAVLDSELVAHEFNSSGVCQTVGCEYVCVHLGSGVSYVEVKSDDDLHMEKGSCTVCGVSMGDGVGASHVYKNGVCARCSHTCKHTSMTIQYEALNDGTHNVVTVCPHGCGLNSTEKQKCVYPSDGSGVCMSCDAEHSHAVAADVTYLPDTVTATHHYIIYLCEGCGKSVTEAKLHNFASVDDEQCECGYSCSHEFEYSFVPFLNHHARYAKCTKCSVNIYVDEEFCTDYQIETRVHEDGYHYYNYHCTFCGGDYNYGVHEEYDCGMCKEGEEYCSVYAPDGSHAKLSEGETCTVCGKVKK